MAASSSRSWAAGFVLLLVGGVLMGLMPSCSGYDFYVGGRDGWVQNPSESFNSWAERTRFQINDRLVFKYKQGEDSVLVVSREAYETCNTTHPIQRMDGGGGGGGSAFRFDRSGPFYFISGEPGRCEKGEKLVVVVLADRNKKQSPLPSPSSPAPALPPSPTQPSSPSSPSPALPPSPTQPSPPSPATVTPPPAPGSRSISPSGAGLTPASPPALPSSSDSASSSLFPVSGASLGLVALVLGGVFLS